MADPIGPDASNTGDRDRGEALIEVIRLRPLEQRRSEIAANAESTRQALREGNAKYGDVNDLRRDLIA